MLTCLCGPVFLKSTNQNVPRWEHRQDWFHAKLTCQNFIFFCLYLIIERKMTCQAKSVLWRKKGRRNILWANLVFQRVAFCWIKSWICIMCWVPNVRMWGLLLCIFRVASENRSYFYPSSVSHDQIVQSCCGFMTPYRVLFHACVVILSFDQNAIGAAMPALDPHPATASNAWKGWSCEGEHVCRHVDQGSTRRKDSAKVRQVTSLSGDQRRGKWNIDKKQKAKVIIGG